jgi:hypothetical protein
MRVARAALLSWQPMNILIEDADALKFFTAEGQWSKTVTEGKIFAGTGLAFKAAKLEPVGRFNIVGYVTETRQFINLDSGRGKGAAEIPA